MKNIFRTVMAIAAAVVLFASCDENQNGSANLATLNSVISECQSVLSTATTADYPQDAINDLSELVNSATALVAKGGLTQDKVDALVVSLQNALATFKEAKYADVPASAIVFGLSMNEGTGTSIKTTGSNKWTAEFVTGPTEHFGTDAAAPKWVEGKKGKALEFSNGAALHISDYAPTALEGSAFSISCWLKPSVVRAGNYVLSYNYWESFKFQVQDGSKPFLTAKTDNGACVDMDNESDNSVPVNTWTHVTVTCDFATKTCCFYINGQLTKEWTKDNWSNKMNSYTPADGKKLPIVVGACTTLAEAKTWSWYPEKPDATNFDCFFGAIDELYYYNVALTAGQVSKIYNN